MSGFVPQLSPFVVVLTVISVLWCALPAFGQSTVLRGFVVHAADDRPIVGRVRVTAIRVDVPSAKAITVASDEFGYFQFPPLPLGRYELTIALQPFQPHVEIVDVVRDPIPTVVLRLQFRDVEDIDVHSPTPAASRLRLPDGSTGAVFSREELDELPQVNGRTVQSLLALVPGIVFTDSVGTLAQFTTGGQRRFSNRLTIDGMSADLALDIRGKGIGEGASGGLPATATSGGTQTLIPQEAIEEITVRTSTASAEHARAPGAQTSIVTRAGGERLSAVGFSTIRPQAWSASDWFANAGEAPRRENSLVNSGASVGGPMGKRWRYFTTWEHLTLSRATTTSVEVPSLAARDGAPEPLGQILAAFPRPNGPDVGGGLAEYTNRISVGSTLWALSGRVDSVGARHRYFARANIGKSAGDALGSAPFQLPFLSYSRRESTSTQTITGGWTWFGSKAFNDFRVNVSDHAGWLDSGAAHHGGARPLDVARLLPNRPANTAVTIVVFPGPYGTIASGRVRENVQQQFQVSDSITASLGRHQFRAGAEYGRIATSLANASHFDNFRFGGVVPLLQGAPAQATTAVFLPVAVSRHSGFLFAQDTWRISDSFTLDYGIRYSVTSPPVSSNALRPVLLAFNALPDRHALPEGTRPWQNSWNDIAPRVSAAYQLAALSDRTTVLRAGIGLVSDTLTTPGALAFGTGAPYFAARHGLVQFPLVDDTESLQPIDLSDYYSFPDDFENPSTLQWQFAVDQELSTTQRLSLAYVGAHGRNLAYWFAYPGSNSRMSVNAVAPLGGSDYHALLGEYVKRLSRGWQARLSYTWSRALDNDSGENSGPNAPPNLVPVTLNRGPADFDRSHSAILSASYQFHTPSRTPKVLRVLCDGWAVAGSVALRSGAPFTPLFERRLNGGLYRLRLDWDVQVPVWLPDATSATGRRLNPEAFVAPGAERQGSIGRNVLRSFPLRQVDAQVSRELHLGRTRVGFRLEIFNLFNTPNFAVPSLSLLAPRFGYPFQSYADGLGTGTLAGGGLSPLQQSGGPRSVQLGVRLGF